MMPPLDITGADAVVGLACALGVAGALVSVLTRDVLRLGLGLGLAFVSVAAIFASIGAGFAAVAQLFLYVGGVLVLLLFALMLLTRSAGGAPLAERRSTFLPALAGLVTTLAIALVAGPLSAAGARPARGALSDALLGPLLAQFEMAGVLLLAALIAIVGIAVRRR